MVKALRHPTRLSVLFNHRSARTPSRKPSPGPHSQGPQPPRLTARPDAVRKQARGKQRDRSPKRGRGGKGAAEGGSEDSVEPACRAQGPESAKTREGHGTGGPRQGGRAGAPARVPRAGRALPAPRPRPHAAGESGSRGAGERGGARQTRGRGSAPLPGGRAARREGSRVAGLCGRRPRPGSAPGLPGGRTAAYPRPRRLARPCPASRSPSLPASTPRPAPARPRAAPGSPAPSPGPPPAPHLPAARRSGRRASAARAPPGPGAAARPLGTLGPLAELCAASGGPPRRTGRPRPPAAPFARVAGRQAAGSLTLPDAPSPPRLPLRPGRALPAPSVCPPLSAAPAPDPDPGPVLAPPSLRPSAPGGPGSASGAHRRTEGRVVGVRRLGWWFRVYRLSVSLCGFSHRLGLRLPCILYPARLRAASASGSENPGKSL